MLSVFLDFLWPRQSLTGHDGAWLTNAEFRAIKRTPVIETRLQLEGQGITGVHRLVAATKYANNPHLQRALYLLKYKRVPSVEKFLTELLLEVVRNESLPHDATLCPVPLHWSRRFTRGCNQSELITRRLARTLQLPMWCGLKRVRPTGHQARRQRNVRQAAVDKAFTVANSCPSCIILVDDIVTTGATVLACTTALRTAGAEQIYVWTVARG